MDLHSCSQSFSQMMSRGFRCGIRVAVQPPALILEPTVTQQDVARRHQTEGDSDKLTHKPGRSESFQFLRGNVNTPERSVSKRVIQKTVPEGVASSTLTGSSLIHVEM